MQRCHARMEPSSATLARSVRLSQLSTAQAEAGLLKPRIAAIGSMAISQISCLVALLLPSAAAYSVASGAGRRAAARMVASESISSACRVNVAHILVLSEDMARLCEQQLAEGADFAELAEGASACESKGVGGQLGWIEPGLMVPEFEFAAFTADEGTVRVVQSELGWHVIKVLGRAFTPPIIEAVELRDRLRAGESEGDDATLTLIDVRDDEEMAQARIPDGVFLHHPYKDWQRWGPMAIAGELPGVDKDKELVLMDHRGGRGERLMQYLAQNGAPSPQPHFQSPRVGVPPPKTKPLLQNPSPPSRLPSSCRPPQYALRPWRHQCLLRGGGPVGALVPRERRRLPHVSRALEDCRGGTSIR